LTYIKPFASTLLSADSTYTSGAVEILSVSTLQGQNAVYYPLASVIVTNKLATNASFYIWVDSTTLPDAFLAYNLSISGYNTYETFRFSMAPTDKLYVAGTTGLVFFVNGILQQSA